MMTTPSVFTYNNKGIHHDHVMPFFALFGWLLKNNTRIYDYIERLGYYSPDDFTKLRERFESGSTKVPMNTKETIILFSIIHYLCCLLVTEHEDEVIREILGEDEAEFLDTRNRLLGFGKITSEELVDDFLKENEEFLKAAEKIRSFTL